MSQASVPKRDADVGVDPWHYRELYEQNGMQRVLDATVNLNDIMRKHLDLREIPELLGSLFPDPEHPMTYIACSETHAVAVTGNTLYDVSDSRNMGDRIPHRSDGTLTELWLKTDDQSTADSAGEIMNRYAEMRRYDDPLTYGRRRRQTVARQ